MIAPEYLEEIQLSLAARAEDVCRHLLPGGKRVGRVWKCGGIDGGPGKSMDVELDGEKTGVWLDRATGDTGRLLKLFELTQGLKFADAVEKAAEFCRMEKPDDEDRKIDPSNFHFTPPPAQRDEIPEYRAVAPVSTVIDWSRCVAEFTPEKAAELCEWRGYSVAHVKWMQEQELVGCFRGEFAFPVHDSKGRVVAIHHKGGDGWFYYPKGAETAPLIIGSPTHALHTFAFESQWDAFSVLDLLDAHNPENAGVYAAVITRSATSNTDFSKLAIANLIAVTQNDPREKNGKPNTNKEGRTPSEEWLHRIQSSRNKITHFAVFEPPSQHKDANDWIRADRPDHIEVFAKVVEGSRNPILKKTKSVSELLDHNIEDDPNALIGHTKRFLCKGGSWMIIGPSGIGKSTLTASLCIHAAAGVTWHGLTFRRPLKTLVVQAENDAGDLAEMLRGACAAARNDFSKPQFKTMGRNLLFEQVTDKIGEKFTRWLEEIIRESKAELVVIDPLLSFVGDDISQQKVASQFFRNFLQPVLERTGAICVLIHHTGKPPKEKVKDSDLSYSGLGSSEIVNWPRAVSVLAHTDQPGVFLFKNCKRGGRAQMIHQPSGMISTEIYLRHGTGSEGSQWLQTTYEPPEEPERAPKARAKAPPRQQFRPEDFISLVMGPITYKDLYDAIRDNSNMNGHAVRKTIDDMLLMRAIVKLGNGKYDRPSPEMI